MTTLAIRNVAVVGHKGAGKTKLVEAMAYVAKAVPRVDDQAAGLDDSPEERAHGATLESRVVTLRWKDAKINVVDTPGEASFLAEAAMALAAVDAAIVVVSAKDGVETGTERMLRAVRERKMPCFVVLTKLDDDNAHEVDLVAEIKSKLKLPVAAMEVPTGIGHDFHGVVSVRTGKAWIGKAEGPGATDGAPVPPESKKLVDDARAHLVDDVAGTDDALTEHYLNDGDLSQEELDQGTKKAVADGKLIPVYETSAIEPHGIAALLDAIVDLLPAPTPRAKANGGTAALLFKTHIDPHSGRISYARVVAGTLRPDMQLVRTKDGVRERVPQLLQGTPRDMKPLPEAVCGDIVAIPKLKAARTGETLCDEKHSISVEAPPLPDAIFSRALIVEGGSRGAEDKVVQTLQRLVDEDPGLVFAHDETSRDLLVSGLGAMHLEITLERLKRRAGVDVKLGPPRVPYKETIRGRAARVEGKIKKQTGGHGQFAVCYIDVEPLPRGAGFEFEDAVVGGVVPRQFIPSVEKGVRRAMEHGALAGYPVVDVKVRLVDGKAHSVDSSDAAFQTAGWRAFRTAMAQANPSILEPIMKLEITVPQEAMGDVIGDLNSRHAKIMGTDNAPNGALITALLPLAQTLDYEPKLTAMTHGRGSFTLGFDHYDYASSQTQERVVKESGYKPIVDDD